MYKDYLVTDTTNRMMHIWGAYLIKWHFIVYRNLAYHTF